MNTKSLALFIALFGLAMGAPASVKPSHSGAPLQPVSSLPPRPTESVFPHSDMPHAHPRGPHPTSFPSPHPLSGARPSSTDTPHAFAYGGPPHSFSGVRPSFTGMPPRPTSSPHPHSLDARAGSGLPRQPAHILSSSPVPHPHGKPPMPTGSKSPHTGEPHPPHSLKAR
ncbi:hypothetical protein FRC08_000330 [Ceratobasidium sp. 394]|nr:hypothetical protein FRC08_000330 [Ceratobasidium sp. 394]